MEVLITCKYEEDPIKNKGTRVVTTLYINISDVQGQITLVLVSGRNLNSSKLSCMSSLPARMRMIDSKMKELECSQDFSHYKSMGIFPDAQGQLTPHSLVRSGRISNLSEMLWMFLLPASMKKIRSKTKFLNVKLVLLSDTYLIIIFAICHCHPFKNELVLVLNTAWRKQPIADYVSNHNRTCGKCVSEN